MMAFCVKRRCFGWVFYHRVLLDGLYPKVQRAARKIDMLMDTTRLSAHIVPPSLLAPNLSPPLNVFQTINVMAEIF